MLKWVKKIATVAAPHLPAKLRGPVTAALAWWDRRKANSKSASELFAEGLRDPRE